MVGETPPTSVEYHSSAAARPAEIKLSPSEELFATVRTVMLRLLPSQTKAWLQRLVEEGVVEKRSKPASYVIRQNGLFGGTAEDNGSQRNRS